MLRTGLLSRGAAGFAALGFLSLVTNRQPLVTAGAWVVTLVLAAAPALRERQKPDRIVGGLVAVWGMWMASLLLTGELLRTLPSFDFHRRDGQIFFSLIPLGALVFLSPGVGGLRALLGLFCGIQAAIALVACAADVAGRREALVGLFFLFDELPTYTNFCALYKAHNAAGSVQALACLVTAALAAFGTGARERWFWGLLTIPLLWGAILSKSRGSLLALAAGVAVLGFLAVRRKAVSRRALLGVAFVLFATGAMYGPRLARRFGLFLEEGGTHGARWTWWKRALEEWAWSPVVGIGMGRYNDEERTFSGVRHLYYVATGGKVVNNAGHAHNSYVHFLAEGGVVGFGITVGFWGWVAWRLRGSREPLRIAAFLGVLYLFAISMTEHYMGGGAMLLVLSSLVGAAWSLPEPPPADKITPS